MKTIAIALSLILMKANFAHAQEIPGLSYCLLFDSKLEKNAFQDTDRSNCDPMIFLLAYDPKIDSVKYEQVRQGIHAFARQIENKRPKFKSELKFMNYVFRKAHNKYLRSFKNTEPFGGIFNDGSYNCVSGTALYSCILTLMGYTPEILETRYHIFLKVATKDSVICLLEATDPVAGFEFKADKIEARITRYLKNEQISVSKFESISAPFNTKSILQPVSLVELGGLHYYNIAVDLVNKDNYYDAFRALKKAKLLYPDSERINDFMHFTQMKHDAELSGAFVDN
jgi:hypothetical protein